MHFKELSWRFIVKIVGASLALESFFIASAAGVSMLYDDWDVWYLLGSAGLCLACGIALMLAGNLREKVRTIGKRESFLTVTLVWISFVCFGAVPFWISGAIPSYTDAFFETMSGFSTTGATILTAIEQLPHGLLFWRSLTQWLGGLGVVVFSLALLPLFGGGVAQLYDAETTGLTHDKFRPRVVQVAKRVWGIYVVFTLILTGLLYLGPMDLYDSVCHAFTTISTGGYSTKQASIAYWDSLYLEGITVLFMIIGATNFALYYFLINGKFKRFFKDEEFRWFLWIIGIAIALVGTVLCIQKPEMGILRSFRVTIFQVVSLITTSGFSTHDYVGWGPFFWIILLQLMIICGCAGSTSGGLKVVRFMALAKNTFNEFGRSVHPRAVIPVRVNGNALPLHVVERLLAFFFLYITVLIFSFAVLLLAGVPFEEAIAASISSLSNVGPGLGSNGPLGSFADLSIFVKWYLSFLMLIGRLEIFTVLILFTPRFWKE